MLKTIQKSQKSKIRTGLCVLALRGTSTVLAIVNCEHHTGAVVAQTVEAYWLEGWGFDPQHRQAATVEFLIKAHLLLRKDPVLLERCILALASSLRYVKKIISMWYKEQIIMTNKWILMTHWSEKAFRSFLWVCYAALWCSISKSSNSDIQNGKVDYGVNQAVLY